MTALHEALFRQAERDPDHAAHVEGERVTTYGALAELVRAFAGALTAGGLVGGDRVCVAASGLDFLVATYATSCAGGVVVPLSPADRSDRSERILDAVGARALVRSLTEIEWRARCAQNLSRDVALVFFTSGTTAAPKGVMLTHANLDANARAIVTYLGLDSSDRVAACLPNDHAYGFSVLHTHVLAGGTIVEAGSSAFLGAVLEAIQTHRCTGLPAVPATLLRLTESEDDFDLSSLRYITQAGAPMTPDLTARVRRTFPRARLFCMYGQTEASARLSYLPPEDLDRKPGSVGLAISGVELTIIDSDDTPLPAGTVGEIVARGPNVMAGYLGDPERTARVLRGGRLHTGDLGYLDEDGYLFVVGRVDDLILVAGHRVGPREIEAAIEALPEVRECAVIGEPDARLGQRIVAHVVGGPPDAEIRAACRRALPAYMVPSRIVRTAELPRSPRGKLLRRAL